MNTSGGKTALDGLPQQRADLITNDTVKNTSCLLGIDQIHINLTRLLDRGLDRGLGNLIEGDAHGLLHGNPQRSCQMPRNGFALAVRVSCEEYFFSGFGFLFDLLDQVTFAANIDIANSKIVVNINAECSFGQIANMSFGCDHFIIGAKVAFDGTCFGGRLHTDQICHVIILSSI